MVSSDCQRMPTSLLNHYFFTVSCIAKKFQETAASLSPSEADGTHGPLLSLSTVVFSVQGCIKQLGPITTVPSGPLNLLPRLVPEYTVV